MCQASFTSLCALIACLVHGKIFHFVATAEFILQLLDPRVRLLNPREAVKQSSKWLCPLAVKCRVALRLGQLVFLLHFGHWSEHTRVLRFALVWHPWGSTISPSFADCPLPRRGVCPAHWPTGKVRGLLTDTSGVQCAYKSSSGRVE